jgi:hypothetical protein
VPHWDDVRRIALGLPETSEGSSRGNASWSVRGKQFVWERPLRDGEIAELGDAAPSGPVLGARVEDLGAKEALRADESEAFFTTSHFDGYRAILVELERVDAASLREVIVEAWLARAPKTLAREYAETTGQRFA